MRLRMLSLVFAIAYGTFPLCAQTIRPVVVEYAEKAKGRFEIFNETLFPLNVVLEPKSFGISPAGEPIFRPLDSHIRLELSQMSFRVLPQQSYYVFYEARPEKLPASFVIFGTISGFPQQFGLNVQVELPHTVYILQKEKPEETDFRFRSAHFDVEGRRIIAEVENLGPRMGRVLQTMVRSAKHELDAGGFPLLPFSSRRLQIDWGFEEDPGKVQLRFKGFSLEEAIPGRAQ